MSMQTKGKKIILGLVVPFLCACSTMKADDFVKGLEKEIEKSPYYKKVEDTNDYIFDESTMKTFSYGFSNENHSFEYDLNKKEKTIEDSSSTFNKEVITYNNLQTTHSFDDKYFSYKETTKYVYKYKKKAEKKEDCVEKSFTVSASRELKYILEDKEDDKTICNCYNKCSFITEGKEDELFVKIFGNEFIPLNEEKIKDRDFNQFKEIEITKETKETQKFENPEDIYKYVDGQLLETFDNSNPIDGVGSGIVFEKTPFTSFFSLLIYNITFINPNVVISLINENENKDLSEEEIKEKEKNIEYKKLSYNKYLGTQFETKFNFRTVDNIDEPKEVTETSTMYTLEKAIPLITCSDIKNYKKDGSDMIIQNSNESTLKITLNDNIKIVIPDEKDYKKIE